MQTSKKKKNLSNVMNNDQGNIENYIDLENYGKSKIIFLKIMIFSRFFSFADFSVLQIFEFCRFLKFLRATFFLILTVY